MKRTNFHFPVDMLAQLKAEKLRTGIPVVELIRRAVWAYLKGVK